MSYTVMQSDMFSNFYWFDMTNTPPISITRSLWFQHYEIEFNLTYKHISQIDLVACPPAAKSLHCLSCLSQVAAEMHTACRFVSLGYINVTVWARFCATWPERDTGATGAPASYAVSCNFISQQPRLPCYHFNALLKCKLLLVK